MVLARGKLEFLFLREVAALGCLRMVEASQSWKSHIDEGEHVGVLMAAGIERHLVRTDSLPVEGRALMEPLRRVSRKVETSLGSREYKWESYSLSSA